MSQFEVVWDGFIEVMSSNKSIAVWCAPISGEAGIKFEVHFNYWRMPDRPQRIPWFRRAQIREHCDFAEIGIMVEDVRLVDKLFLYLPATLAPSEIGDCSPYFVERDVVQGIFNELLTAQARTSGPLVLKRSNGRIFCRMHWFSPNAAQTGISNTELTVRAFDVGTLCTIQPAALRACEAKSGASRAYFRLRITMPADKENNPFVEDIPVYDRALLSGYDQIEYLDFRLNEARTLPTVVETRMASDQPASAAHMTLVAFLTAVPVSAELSVANTEFHKMRLLEYPIWSTYAPGLPRGMVVYHWKRTAKGKPITDFSAFVKLQIRRSGRATLVRYLGVAFAFGVLGNLTAGWLQDPVDHVFMALWTGLCGLAALLLVTGKLLWTYVLDALRR
ncbi:hypothetical protein [Mesorhizobium salmacidum]|uniref:Uncharacterized protein n=1 Tax=Mesorhizobium salmacidum TaxID=3015171 RepID=A0ABU8L4M8_9HYPH